MYEKPKKILVDGSETMVVAHQTSDSMLEIVRLDQKIIVDFATNSVMMTSPKHVNGRNVYTTVTATNGKIDEGELSYRPEKTVEPPEGKQFKLDENGEKVKDDDGNFVFEDKPAE